jgi:6,7-dimethyl-8-ribityllumazine synthase
MSNTKKSLSETEGIPSGKGLRVGIVLSEWNNDITELLLDGCKGALVQFDVSPEDIIVSKVPGAFELPLGAKWIASSTKLDAIICIGCVIKGETKHDEFIAIAVSNAIMNLNLVLNIPVIFGVLTPKNHKQALERSGGKYGNKGVEAATTAIRMIHLKKELTKSDKKIGF